MTPSLLLLALTTTPRAHATELLWDGHYRSRAELYDSLSLSEDNAQAEGLSASTDHRFLLQPTWHLTHRIRIHSQLDLLRGVPWGSEVVSAVDPVTGDSLSPLMGATVQSTTTDDDAATLYNLAVTRVWSEVDTPAGVVKFGRMPLHWGSGMVWNAGTDILDEAGDTMDRIQFTGKAGEVYLTGAYEARIENFEGESDDYHGLVGQVLYQTEQAGVGTTHVLRTTTGDSSEFRLYTGDIWAAAQMGDAYIEAEFAANLARGDLDTGENNLSIGSFGGHLEAGYAASGLRLGLAGGFATGDANPDDSSIKTFTFDPDFNISLMLFEEAMPILEASTMNDTNAGRTSDAVRVGDGVSNALYLRPKVGYQASDSLKADLYLLAANQAKPAEGFEDQKGYGMEIGTDIEWRPLTHVRLSATTAVFLPGTYFTEYEHESLGGDFNRPAVGGRLIGSVEF